MRIQVHRAGPRKSGIIFFAVARESGVFQGGSGDVADITERIDGFMRFDADSLEALTDLLKRHPTVVHGGTIEICEMPKT